MQTPDFHWAGLPEDLRYGLLLGGVGKPHLMDLARRALGSPDTARIGLDLLLGAWEAGPLDGGLARTLTSLDARTGFLPSGVRSAVDAAAANWREPADMVPMARMAAGREHARLLHWLGERFRQEPGNLFWRQHFLDLAYLLADWERALEVLKAPWPRGLEAVRDKCLGDVRYQQGDFGAARGFYASARLLRPARFRMGQCLFWLGQAEEATGQWHKALAQAPWNVNILLRLHDRILGLDQSGTSLPGRVAVCLYTSGKARELDATLAALFASNLGEARVVVLDNGSRDATPEVLAAWKGRFGQTLEIITLPVNIGAPAARNWLAWFEEVQACDFVVYLDDDALVPPDWPGLFSRAVQAYPEAGVWGCKVVDLAAPGRIQHADINLLEDGGADPAFATLCTQDLDFGQFDFVRPCLSVTGCFHLFRTSVFKECGDFDIRFSPTQYDDLDHDLRLAELGRSAVYQGQLAVRHARLSGALLHQDPQATGNSLGNLRKLSAKHPSQARQALLKRTAGIMLADVLAKSERVLGKGPHRGGGENS